MLVVLVIVRFCTSTVPGLAAKSWFAQLFFGRRTLWMVQSSFFSGFETVMRWIGKCGVRILASRPVFFPSTERMLKGKPILGHSMVSG